jgi:hypothetical protein
MLRFGSPCFALSVLITSIVVASSGCGGGTTPPPMTQANAVAPSQPKVQGTTVSDIEKRSDWQSCDVCAGAEGLGPAGEHGMVQRVPSPSRDGASTQFWISGSTPYTNALFWNTIIGDDQTAINQSAHHFVLDLYFYLDNPQAAETLEWDVNQFVDGHSLIFGSQCSYRSNVTWDIWDNVNKHWISTGISCPAPAANTWNHVTLEFERTDTYQVHYVAMTMNGERHQLDWYYDSIPSPWNGIDVNVQLDGNFQQEHYSEWINNMSLTYW